MNYEKFCEIVKTEAERYLKSSIRVETERDVRRQTNIITLAWRPTLNQTRTYVCHNLFEDDFTLGEMERLAGEMALSMDFYLSSLEADAKEYKKILDRRHNRWYRRLSRWIKAEIARAKRNDDEDSD